MRVIRASQAAAGVGGFSWTAVRYLLVAIAVVGLAVIVVVGVGRPAGAEEPSPPEVPALLPGGSEYRLKGPGPNGEPYVCVRPDGVRTQYLLTTGAAPIESNCGVNSGDNRGEVDQMHTDRDGNLYFFVGNASDGYELRSVDPSGILRWSTPVGRNPGFHAIGGDGLLWHNDDVPDQILLRSPSTGRVLASDPGILFRGFRTVALPIPDGIAEFRSDGAIAVARSSCSEECTISHDLLLGRYDHDIVSANALDDGGYLVVTWRFGSNVDNECVWWVTRLSASFEVVSTGVVDLARQLTGSDEQCSVGNRDAFALPDGSVVIQPLRGHNSTKEVLVARVAPDLEVTEVTPVAEPSFWAPDLLGVDDDGVVWWRQRLNNRPCPDSPEDSCEWWVLIVAKAGEEIERRLISVDTSFDFLALGNGHAAVLTEPSRDSWTLRTVPFEFGRPTWTEAYYRSIGVSPECGVAVWDPCSGDPFVYVALGDSFSSGVGTLEVPPPSDDDSPVDGRCYRTLFAYSQLVKERVPLESGRVFRHVACGGARSFNHSGSVDGSGRTQLSQFEDLIDAPGGRVDLVTATMLGNDAGFSSILVYCAVTSSCDDDFREHSSRIEDWVYARAVDYYSELRAVADSVYVVGYPMLLPADAPPRCDALFDAGEREWFRETQAAFDDELRRAADDVGVWFVSGDLGPGTEACAPGELIHFISASAGGNSFHPKPGAHQITAANIVNRHEVFPQPNPTPTGIDEDRGRERLAISIGVGGTFTAPTEDNLVASFGTGDLENNFLIHTCAGLDVSLELLEAKSLLGILIDQLDGDTIDLRCLSAIIDVSVDCVGCVQTVVPVVAGDLGLPACSWGLAAAASCSTGSNLFGDQYEPTVVDFDSCPGGIANFQVVTVVGETVEIPTTLMSEGPPGHYVGSFDPPGQGQFRIDTSISCPGDTAASGSRVVNYIDPSGQITDCAGDPVIGAEVLLLRADSASGPFEPVPDGSEVMSPDNRANPSLTDGQGKYRWDTIAGFYIVEASGPGYSTVQSEVLEIPPPRFDVDLQFPECLDSDIVGAHEMVEVGHVVSCLAGNGRVDTNIVNTTTSDATYRIEFEGLTPRQFDVAPTAMWRMPITGRADRTYDVAVLRDGEIISQTQITVACDTDPPVVDSDEVRVVHSCLNGAGLVRFQFVNPTNQTRAWIITFGNLSNRSTSTTAYGQALRGISGRPNGTYPVTIESAGSTIAQFTVTVACASP